MLAINPERRVRRKIRPRKLLRALTWLGVVIAALVAAGLGAKAYYSNIAAILPPTHNSKQFPGFNHRVTILLMGSSLETSATGQIQTGKHVQDRTDTMMLVSINPSTHQVGVISIPRDTRVYIPHIGMTKIAEASFFGGVKESVQVVENTFHVPVDYYAYISMYQFANFVNDMGGITMYVPHTEIYQPSGGKLGIDLHKGLQHLSGWQVLAFARYRNTNQGDIGRIQQQQLILRTMAHQLLQPKYIPMIPKLVGDLSKALAYTNLNTNQLLALALLARHVSLSTVRFGTLAGHASTHMDPYLHTRLSYWTYDPHLASILIQDVLLVQPLTAAQKSSLTIYVASGTSSLAPATTLAQKLKQQGYDVVGVGWGNRHNRKRSVIINTTGDKWLGNRLAQLLGPTQDTFSAYHTQPWDIKITVGSDYTGK